MKGLSAPGLLSFTVSCASIYSLMPCPSFETGPVAKPFPSLAGVRCFSAQLSSQATAKAEHWVSALVSPSYHLFLSYVQPLFFHLFFFFFGNSPLYHGKVCCYARSVSSVVLALTQCFHRVRYHHGNLASRRRSLA